MIPDRWEFPSFSPGQHAILGLPGSAPRVAWSDSEPRTPPPGHIIKRPYSIASSSVDHAYLEFYIDLVRSGALSPRIFALQTGDRIWLSEQTRGLFTLEQVPSDRNILLIATGTGLAPYMSMVRTNLGTQTHRTLAVIHGARHSSELGYRSELQSIRRLCSNFFYLPAISRPEQEPVPWTGAVGRIQDLFIQGEIDRLTGNPPTAENTHIFLCGNPEMIMDMVEKYEERGFKEHSRRSAGNLHVERFW
ncbi:MAG TPA: ferredoxin--NADP reductase [Thermoanaerobaculia bacterium]|nr:ferredoxin--NADP reductase [Thermoanaerobaculia bacterium]HUM30388.1 ferredoxin--NADP reductase [Thermoanaerobaculia bacterium]HXK68601.1 ferredoxin--NADP reductase [Thermoanaerobaculia bacterium]